MPASPWDTPAPVRVSPAQLPVRNVDLRARAAPARPAPVAVPTASIVTYPTVAALVDAERFVGPNRTWDAVSPQQRVFFSCFFGHGRKDLGRIPEIAACAAPRTGDLAGFMRRHGIEIVLPEMNPACFGIATVLDLPIRWHRRGRPTEVRGAHGHAFPGVRLDRYQTEIRAAAGRRDPVIVLKTTAGDTVAITPLDAPTSGFGLTELALHIQSTIGPVVRSGDVVLPMVEYERVSNSPWIIGTRTRTPHDTPAFLQTAVQRTYVRFSEEGATTGTHTPPPTTESPAVVIDRPFLLWVLRPGCDAPLFVAYVSTNEWKRPTGF